MEVNMCTLLHLLVKHVSQECKSSSKKASGSQQSPSVSSQLPNGGQPETCLLFEVFLWFILPLITEVSAEHLALLKTCPSLGVLIQGPHGSYDNLGIIQYYQ